MAIENFNPEEFGKNPFQQACQLVPKDLTEEQQKYVVNKVYQFCVLAGNALNQDQNLSLNSNQAVMITQFIGEWTFHKSIDLIKSGVPHDCWDQVLQEIAFAVYETAKQTQINGIDPEKTIGIVEKAVNASYENSLRELAKNRKINEAEISNILTYSNIDKMAEKQNPPDNPSAQQPQQTQQAQIDQKSLKFAAIAILLKTLSKEKFEKILASMDAEQVAQIKKFLAIPNLEQKVDPAIVEQFLKDFKNNMNSIKQYVQENLNPFDELKELFSEIEIKKAVQGERKKIKEYVNYCLVDIPTSYKNVEFSPLLSKVIANYIKDKLIV
ncbi:MAG: hypothetical protein MZU97_09230 [Bacillus subtilis]|nr:hypothetical protein [Bacillus subtilis]